MSGRRIMLFSSLLLMIASSITGQNTGPATATYAKNGKLLSLTNIVDLRDCPTRNLVGKARKVRVTANLATFELRGEDERTHVEVDLNQIGPAERKVIFTDLVRSGYKLRVSGYACTERHVISAFSVYRE